MEAFREWGVFVFTVLAFGVLLISNRESLRQFFVENSEKWAHLGVFSASVAGIVALAAIAHQTETIAVAAMGGEITWVRRLPWILIGAITGWLACWYVFLVRAISLQKAGVDRVTISTHLPGSLPRAKSHAESEGEE